VNGFLGAIMEYQERLETALQAANPIGALRSLALALHAAGCGREQIVEIFLGFHDTFQEQGRVREEDLIGDVVDMITGCYAGNNLEFPDRS
jgi:hypothetical protein